MEGIVKRWIPFLYISWEVGSYLTTFRDTGLEWESVFSVYEASAHEEFQDSS